VAWVCDVVASRAAALSACAVAATLIQCKYVEIGGGPGVKVPKTALELGVDGRCVATHGILDMSLMNIVIASWSSILDSSPLCDGLFG